MNHSRWRAVPLMLAGLCLVTLAGGLWGALSWSLIPQRLDGTIEKVQYESESGYRWRILTLEDGTRQVIDRRIINPFSDWRDLEGQAIRKDRGETRVHIGERTVGLVPSIEFWKVLFCLTATSGVVLWRARSMPHREATP